MAKHKLFIKGASKNFHHFPPPNINCFVTALFCIMPLSVPIQPKRLWDKKRRDFIDTKIDKSKFLVAQNIVIFIYILYTQYQPTYRRHDKFKE